MHRLKKSDPPDQIKKRHKQSNQKKTPTWPNGKINK